MKADAKNTMMEKLTADISDAYPGSDDVFIEDRISQEMNGAIFIAVAGAFWRPLEKTNCAANTVDFATRSAIGILLA